MFFATPPRVGGLVAGRSPADLVFQNIHTRGTLVSQVGPALTFTRATASSTVDFENMVRNILSGEARHHKLRRVENLYPGNTDVATTQSVTCVATTYILSAKGTGSVTLSGAGSGSLSPGGASIRKQLDFTPSAGSVTFTVSGSITQIQLQQTSGQAIQVADEYVSGGVLSSPWHGAGVDRVKFFATANGNTKDGAGVITEATGAALDLSGAGILVHYSYANLRLNNTNWANASFTGVDTTPTANNVAAPNGLTQSALITEGTAGTAEWYQAYTRTANTVQTSTFFLRRGNTDWIRLFINDGTETNKVEAWVNLNTGAVGSVANTGTGSGAAVFIRQYGQSHYECVLTGNPASAGTTARAGTSSASADASTTRVNNATYYGWGGVIINNANLPNAPHVDTGASSVTVNADDTMVSTSNISGFNANEGTLYMKAINTPVGTAFATGVSLFQDFGDTIQFQTISGTLRAFSRQSSVEQCNINLGDPGAGESFRAAVRWKTNDIGASRNGSAEITDATAVIPNMPTLGIGTLAGGATGWNAVIQETRLYKKARDTAALTQ